MVRSPVPRVPAARGRRRAHSFLTVAIPLVAFLPSQSSAQAIAPNPSAAVLRAPSYSSEAVPNAIGPAIQRNCLSRGGEAAGCASLARNAGGVGQGYGVSRVLANAWQGAKNYSSWDQSAATIVGACTTGAALGFTASFVISTPIGGALGPPGAGLGCGVGMIGGVAAILGNAANGAARCVLKDCTLKMQTDQLGKNADASGEGAGGSSAQTKPGNMEGYTFPRDSSGNPTVAGQQAAIDRFGYNNFFLYRIGPYGYWQKGFFYKVVNSRDGDAYGYVRSDDRFQIEAGMRFCSGYYRTNTCLPDKQLYYTTGIGGDYGSGTYGLLLGCCTYYNAGENMPSEPKVVIESVLNQPLLTVPYSGVVKPEYLQKEVSPSLLADLANAAYKMVSDSGTLPAGVPAFSPAQPITPDEMDSARQASGANPVRLGDMIATPTLRQGQESIPGGTVSTLTKPPQDVNIIGGGTGTGTSGGGNGSDGDGGSKDVDWDDGDAEPSDIYQPWRDWMEGPFRQYLHPGNIVPPSINGCPPIAFDFTDFMRDKTGLAPDPKTYTQHCDFILKPLKPLGGKSLREILIPIFHMLATWAGFKILMTGRAHG